MPQELILVVDDELNIIELVRLYLEKENFKVISASDGFTAIETILHLHPALVVLDIMLPELDGLEVCKRLRTDKNQVPIIMLTAKDEDIDKILGLELGADDYLTKPFNPRELVARVKAILRRDQKIDITDHQVLIIGDISIDLARREVKCNDRTIDLRTQEFEVLTVLANNPGLVMTREKLLNLAWGYDFYGQTRTVDVHVAQLRRKLTESKTTIETVTGVGYKLVV